MCSAGIVGRLVMWQPSVGKRMLRWNSTGPRTAIGLGVSPAGKEKATCGGHGKERTGLTRPIARRRTMIEHGHFRWRPEQFRTAVSFCPKSGRAPPGLSPPVLTSSTWDAFRDSETEFDDEELTMKVDMVKPLKRRKHHMPRSTFISKSQAKKKAGKSGTACWWTSRSRKMKR